jgi:hypothetical protein
MKVAVISGISSDSWFPQLGSVQLAGLNLVQDNALLLTPLAQVSAAKFRTVVGAQLRGAARALD